MAALMRARPHEAWVAAMRGKDAIGSIAARRVDSKPSRLCYHRNKLARCYRETVMKPAGEIEWRSSKPSIPEMASGNIAQSDNEENGVKLLINSFKPLRLRTYRRHAL